MVDPEVKLGGEMPTASWALHDALIRHGGPPRALIIGCGSHFEPLSASQNGLDGLIVCRNAGAMVPAFGSEDESVLATVEYAVVADGVRDIVVTGHVDCSAMRVLLDPEKVESMPSVAAWLTHAGPALDAVLRRQPRLDEKGKLRALAMVNVALQLNHLRGHPSVAAAVAEGRLALHGWFFDAGGRILVFDDDTGEFTPPQPDGR